MAYTKISGVYRIHCSGNQKAYIGSAVSLMQRLASHFSLLKRGAHTNRHLQSAYEKYGKASFSADIMLICNEEDRIRWEQYFINAYDAADPEFGMNNSWTATTSVGFKHSDQTKDLLSEKMRGRYPPHLKAANESRKGSPGHSLGKPGKPWTYEMRLQASITRRGKPAWNKGAPKPQEEKDRIAETCRRKAIERVGISSEAHNKILSLREDGLSFPKIAKLVGVSMATCYRHATGGMRTLEKIKGAA